MSPNAAVATAFIELGVEEPLNGRALAVRVDEVAAAAVVEIIDSLDAYALPHFPVAFVDEALALAAECLEIACGNYPLEDEEAFLLEAG